MGSAGLPSASPPLTRLSGCRPTIRVPFDAFCHNQTVASNVLEDVARCSPRNFSAREDRTIPPAAGVAAATAEVVARTPAGTHGGKPFGGPEHVLHYLARYTHRVAISNHRLISLEDGKVTFRWKDYAHGGKKRK